MSDRTTTIVAPLARWSSRIALFSACVAARRRGAAPADPVPDAALPSISLPSAVAGARPGGAGRARGPGPDLAQGLRRGRQRRVRRPAALPGAGLAAHLRAGLLQPAAHQRRDDGSRRTRRGSWRWPSSARAMPTPAAYPGPRFARAAEGLSRPAHVRRRPLGAGGLRAGRGGRAQAQVAGGSLRAAADRARRPRPACSRRPTRRCVVGFTDDIVIRVEGSVNRSRIDVRSASRYGRHDLGQNATRVRRFFAELQTRIDSTSPGVAGRRGLRTTRAGAHGQEGERARSGESGESQRTRPAFNQVLNVREHRKRRSVEELGVEALVDHRHDGARPYWCRCGCIRGSTARACAGAAGRP